MKRIVALLNSMPTVKAALIMGVFMFGASVAGGIVSRILMERQMPKVKINCVCEP